VFGVAVEYHRTGNLVETKEGCASKKHIRHTAASTPANARQTRAESNSNLTPR
jgi:hypothetical protein